jgi:hypothetical protein
MTPSHHLRLLLAKALAGCGQFNAAIEHLHKSISMSPNNCAEALREFERVEVSREGLVLLYAKVLSTILN